MKVAFTKRLNYLQPANASKRFITSTSPTIEKAYIEMTKSQERFNSEREKLRQGLHTSITTPYDSFLFMSSKPTYRALIPKEITPEIILKNSKLTIHSRSVPKLSQRKLEKFEDIIEECENLKSQTESFISKVPKMKKSIKRTVDSTKKLMLRLDCKERLFIRIKNNYN